MRQSIDLSLIAGSYLVAGLAMMGPAIVAIFDNEHRISQSFFYCGLLIIFFSVIANLASQRRTAKGSEPAAQLIALLFIFLTSPIILAIPLMLALESPTGIFDLYFEMVSCLTTTGASALQRPIEMTEFNLAIVDRLPAAVIFWRAEVAWIGGLLIWLAAAAIFAPLGIGGYELVDQAETRGLQTAATTSKGLTRRGIWHFTLIYIVLTLALWLLLLAVGDRPVDALMAAMSTLSTSGITSGGGFSPPSGRFIGEIFVGLFFILALSRWSTSPFRLERMRAAFVVEREFALAFLLVLIFVAIAIITDYEQFVAVRTWSEVSEILAKIWGSIFAALSFLTTTGFRSLHWESVSAFQLHHFALLSLMGLALIGGGVATTASGLKLLRIEKLMRFGAKELSHLAYPSSIPTHRNPLDDLRELRSERFIMAGIFVVLFLILLAIFAIVFALMGSGFDQAFILSVSSLTNTGPLANAMLGKEFFHGELNTPSKLLLCLAMIFGRIEILVFLSLISPYFLKSPLFKQN